MKTIKVWQVGIGNNWCACDVIARNIYEAGRKALKKEAPIPKEERWVREIKLLTEASN